MKKRIFYSWQSDLPNNTNRGFINNAIESAIKEIVSSDSYSIIPFLDRDTIGLTGSPDISASIFNKIDDSSIFICDVSIINIHVSDIRRTPNPNVLFELGYAVCKLNWDKIILILNEEYGGVENLPFDLRGRRILTYKISSNSNDKAEERKKVTSILKKGILEILEGFVGKEVEKNKEKSITKQQKIDSKTDQQAQNILRAIKSISYSAPKTEAAINTTNKYMEKGRYDLAVDFALEIVYSAPKNEYLVNIANYSIKNNDFITAQKSIDGIPYTASRNKLSLEMLELLGK